MEEIFYGNIDPNTSTFEHDSNYGCAVEKISDNEEKLIKILGEPAKSVFMDFANAQMEINSLTATEKFLTGFKFGALLMIEIFTNHDELFFQN